LAAYNIGIYNNLVKVQIKNWVKEAEEREELERTKTSFVLGILKCLIYLPLLQTD
jgi:hypothetical protein